MVIGSIMRIGKSFIAIMALAMFACSAPAQSSAYDDAGNYLVYANWTNGANQGFAATVLSLAPVIAHS